MKTLAYGIVLSAILGLSLPNTTFAQSPDALLQEGLELRRQGRDADALGRFEQAYRLGQSAQALAQIALAEQALGRFEAAETHLSTAVQIRNDPWIATRLPQLEQALASIQAQLGTLYIDGGTPGAIVYINGEARGSLPDASRQRVRAGTVVIELRADGYLPVQRQVQVQAGGSWREPVQMVASQGQVAPPPVTVAPPGGQPTYTQPQAHVSREPNWKLFAAGVGIFGGLWLLTGIITASISESGEAIGYAFIPVAGPFILLDQADDEFFFTILLIDGIAQAAGLVLAVLGLVLQQETTTYALGEGREAPTLTLNPWASPLPTGGAAAGLDLTLTHF